MIDYFLYNTGNGVNWCRNEENIPENAVEIFKVQDGELFFMENGKWKNFLTIHATQNNDTNVFPENPIDAASMLINATVTCNPSEEGTSISSLSKSQPYEIPKYDTLQLEEIARHLLLYCEIQRRGCGDACSEDYKPKPL